MPSSRASAGSSGGNMPGRRAASIDLPDPGGPVISRLCSPAAAISSARLALSWPLTSCRSRPAGRAAARLGSGGGSSWVPLKWVTIANRLGGGMASISPGDTGQRAVERQLPECQVEAELLSRQNIHRRQQGQGDRQIKVATFLENVGWGKVDGNPSCRQRQTQGAERCPYPLARFGNCLVRQSDHGECR